MGIRTTRERISNNICRPLDNLKWLIYQLQRSSDNDYLLVTMPGAGTHWIRTVLSRLVIDEFDLPDEISGITQPDIVPTYRNIEQRFKYNDQINIPRVQHTHMPYSPWFFFHYEHLVIMVRDLRSVLVSHYRTFSSTEHPDLSFADFLRGENMQRKGQVNNHTLLTLILFLNQWGAALGKYQNKIVIRYEDFITHTPEKISDIGSFIFKKPLTESYCREVQEFSSRSSMKKMEEVKPLQQYQGKMTKVREVSSDDFSSYYSQEDIDYFNDIVKQNLNYSFGYDYSQES